MVLISVTFASYLADRDRAKEDQEDKDTRSKEES